MKLMDSLGFFRILCVVYLFYLLINFFNLSIQIFVDFGFFGNFLEIFGIALRFFFFYRNFFASAICARKKDQIRFQIEKTLYVPPENPTGSKKNPLPLSPLRRAPSDAAVIPQGSFKDEQSAQQ